jgi:hypothetical protein
MPTIVSYRQPLRQRLPEILGSVDYRNFRETLGRMREVIAMAELDRIVVAHWIRVAEEEGRRAAEEKGKRYRELSYTGLEWIQKMARQALRCGIGRSLMGDSYREFSTRLADSPLLQHFCEFDTLGPIRIPGKSTLERNEKKLPEGVIREAVCRLVLEAGGMMVGSREVLELSEPIDMDAYFVDTTCLKANIHFPVDWVLMRDATKTLMKAVRLIRRHGLKHRMQEPWQFIKEMNRLCIQMTHARNRSAGKKSRKKILRVMKQLTKKIAGHAGNHRELLVQRRGETDLTERQAAQIVKRLDGVLEQLPEAMRQAHERIIGERLVKNKEKILSLYDEDLHVIVRGKAGARVEFGNTLLLSEQRQGVIVDWKLYREGVPSDATALVESLERARENYEGHEPVVVGTDRGFSSARSRGYLERRGIRDCMCPKSVSELRFRMEDEEFREQQSRRGQTEGRIGILKNNFLGQPLRGKGFSSRELSVAWAVLAHNLWVIARLPRAAAEQERQAG